MNAISTDDTVAPKQGLQLPQYGRQEEGPEDEVSKKEDGYNSFFKSKSTSAKLTRLSTVAGKPPYKNDIFKTEDRAKEGKTLKRSVQST